MPEYLAPGVFVEEVSFRSKSIEGVATSTTGFAGLARYGPVCYPNGPSTCEPRLITSFTEFERVYGGIEPLRVGADDASAEERVGYLAHAARVFFENGGKRLYVSRVFAARGADDPPTDFGTASLLVNVGAETAHWRARWPGRAGNVHVTTEVVRSKNIAVVVGGAVQAPRARAGAVVEISIPADTPPVGNDPLVAANLRVVAVDEDGVQSFIEDDAGTVNNPSPGDVVQLVELRVTVRVDGERQDVYLELAGSPLQKRYIGHIMQRSEPENPESVLWLDWQPPEGAEFVAASLMVALQGVTTPRLAGGHDGRLASPDDLAGQEADPDDLTRKATGLAALGEIDDIAIVALPDAGDLGGSDFSEVAAGKLITHAERERYRIAIVDPPKSRSLSQVRDFRGKFDTKYAALYYSWIEVLDPLARRDQGAPPPRLLLPPSGFVAGIYARSDSERGVHKAPANEVVRGLTRFEVNINDARNEVLNPEGINALRFFEGRGHRVWGARTMSSDPEWKYVNVRRLFNFIENSIDKGTQWAVFEPNNPRLWASVRRAVEDFLLVLWKDGALLGSRPEEAFFVRCDRTTMTQNDLDNGRLICLVGIAPVKPAEFVIFRVGQWTADSQVA